MSDSHFFYNDIAPFCDFSRVAQREHYHVVPVDWDIVLTDIEGSTRAIEEGRYKEVNALGAASIIAVTNAVRKVMPEVELPFVFGGDGATLLIPKTARKTVIDALSKLGTRASQFIDGSNGGYASASVQLKQQLKDARATELPLELPLPHDLYPAGSGPAPITERAI